MREACSVSLCSGLCGGCFWCLSKRLFIYHVRHIGGIAVAFQHLHQALHTTACHTLGGIGGKPRHPSGAGKVGEQAQAIFELGIA